MTPPPRRLPAPAAAALIIGLPVLGLMLALGDRLYLAPGLRAALPWLSLAGAVLAGLVWATRQPRVEAKRPAGSTAWHPLARLATALLAGALTPVLLSFAVPLAGGPTGTAVTVAVNDSRSHRVSHRRWPFAALYPLALAEEQGGLIHLQDRDLRDRILRQGPARVTVTLQGWGNGWGIYYTDVALPGSP